MYWNFLNAPAAQENDYDSFKYFNIIIKAFYQI